jgi:hypothetical protein
MIDDAADVLENPARIGEDNELLLHRGRKCSVSLWRSSAGSAVDKPRAYDTVDSSMLTADAGFASR